MSDTTGFMLNQAYTMIFPLLWSENPPFDMRLIGSPITLTDATTGAELLAVESSAPDYEPVDLITGYWNFRTLTADGEARTSVSFGFTSASAGYTIYGWWIGWFNLTPFPGQDIGAWAGLLPTPFTVPPAGGTLTLNIALPLHDCGVAPGPSIPWLDYWPLSLTGDTYPPTPPVIGSSYTAVGGTWVNQGGSIEEITNTSGAALVWDDQQTTYDLWYDAQYWYTGASNGARSDLALRWADANNHILFDLAGFNGVAELYDLTGGVATTLGTVAISWPVGSIIQIHVHDTGSALTITLNGTVSLAVTTSLHAGNSKKALYNVYEDGPPHSASWSNLRVE